jgi:hypothetical protein
MAEIAGCELFRELLLECNERCGGKSFPAAEVLRASDKYKLDFS